jgi:hypothetical protein
MTANESGGACQQNVSPVLSLASRTIEEIVIEEIVIEEITPRSAP